MATRVERVKANLRAKKHVDGWVLRKPESCVRLAGGVSPCLPRMRR